MKAAHGLIVVVLVAAAAIAAGPVAAQPLPPQMHTVAGGGSCTTPVEPPPLTPPTGLPCNGVSATKVPINEARSVAALPGGAFLYVDEGDGLVQEVSHGTVTTVAEPSRGANTSRASHVTERPQPRSSSTIQFPSSRCPAAAFS